MKLPLLTLFALLAFASSLVAVDDLVELVIPLEDGRYYRRLDVQRELHAKLGGEAPGDSTKDERLELRRAEKAALLLAELAGAMKVRLEDDRLVLSIRRSRRRDLERILAVGWGLTPPRRYDPRRRNVVLIHGLEAGPTDMQGMADAFERWGVQVFNFEYPNDGPLALSGERLSEDLKAFASEHRGFQTVIVAHSMGGLVARYCLETPGKNPDCVTHLFSVATPHRGSNLAIGQEWLEFVFNAAPRRAGRKWNIVNDGQGQAARDLTPGSDFLNALNRRTKPQDAEYHAAIGVKGVFIPEEQPAIAAEVERTLVQRGVNENSRRAVLAFLRSPELCTGQGDGAVTRASAAPPQADSRREFQLNHLELIRLPEGEPEDHPVFRWIVETLGWPKSP